MDNGAFKDLVHKQGRGPSTKEIARKAVEEEEGRKQKKRRRRGGGGPGGGYQSSSEEDEDEDGEKRRKKEPPHPSKGAKERPGGADGHADGDDPTLQKELASRYRDRARERREGREAAPVAGSEKKDDPNEFLIVPHNKKGLDLALARKERKGLARAGSGGAAESSLDVAARRNASLSVAEALSAEGLPEMNEAIQTLRDFVASNSGKDTGNVSQNRAMMDYVRETLDWTVDWNTTSRLDATTFGTAGRTLQHTNYSMAIDGHPSDTARAWEVPRQVTRPGVRDPVPGGIDSAPMLLTHDLLSQTDSVFQARRRLLEAMKQSAGTATLAVAADGEGQHEKERANCLSSARRRKEIKGTPEGAAASEDGGGDDDDDDDIFGGGIGDYVPQVALPAMEETRSQHAS